MSQQPTSKKWVDYSESDSSDEEHHEHQEKQKQSKNNSKDSHVKAQQDLTYKPSPEDIQSQLMKLDRLDDEKVEEVWLLMSSLDQEYVIDQIKYLRGKTQKGGNIVSVYPSKNQEGSYDVLVYINVAYDYIEQGYDKSQKMKIVVHQRNFNRSSNPNNKKRDNYKEKNGGERNNKNQKEGEKKRYVDKETGKQPEAKKKMEEKTMENNQRRYTKQEAEKKGQMLGGFRNKASKTQLVSEPVVVVEPVVQAPQIKKVVQPEVKEVIEKKQVVKEVKPKQVKEKKEKKSTVTSPKPKSSNRFEGIEDLD